MDLGKKHELTKKALKKESNNVNATTKETSKTKRNERKDSWTESTIRMNGKK